MPERNDKDEAESRRILERVTNPAAQGFLMRTAESTRDRLTAADADPDDRIEIWGTRIGRTLGAGVLLVGYWNGV